MPQDLDLTERQSTILDQIRSEGRAEVEALSDRLAVSTQTIRRDLNELCARGLARRTHGGAIRRMSVSNEGHEARRLTNAQAKEWIGRATARLIPDNCSVALNIGTTTEQVARGLVSHEGLVVLTNNVNIVTTLMGSATRELILAGGTVRPLDGAIVGAQAVEFIARYRVDFAVIGASSLDTDGTALDFDSREVSVARAILDNARTRILACDGSKFQRSAPVRICSLDDLDYVVTDHAPKPFFAAARAAGVEVVAKETEHVSI